jgi:hypothetical protein
MDDKQKYIEDLQDIKEMMSRSSRVISLSGISGIMAGVIALGSAYLAYITVYSGQNYLGYRRATITNESLLILLGIALATIVLTVSISLFFTIKKAKISSSSMWDSQTKRLLINLSIPLSTGGIFCLILLSKGYIGIIAPLTLIFYGLALVNASKYMLSDIKGLGLLEIVLGLLAAQFIGYGLLFWAIGFGVLHIIYGIIMHIKYDS